MKIATAILIMFSAGLLAVATSRETKLEAATYLVDANHVHGTAFATKFNNQPLLVTNAHVCENSKDGTVSVSRSGARFIPSQSVAIVKQNKDLDLCVLAAPHTANEFFALGGTPALKSSVRTIGYPGGVGPVYKYGFVAAFDTSEKPLIDVLVITVKPGASGSPLLNPKDEVVGVIFAYSIDFAGVGYAVDVTTLKTFLEEK